MSFNFIVGCISHLPDSLDNIQERCEIHALQLRWLESLGLDFDFYQVEGAWGKTANEICQTNLNTHHLTTGSNPPGFNRNLLLEVLYNSDYDWLVCMDDDRRYYPMFNADAIFRDLGTEEFVNLAKRGCLILSVDPMVAPFKKTNFAFQNRETHWYITKGSPNGFLQICFIPNLVKFGFKPVYFNGDTRCTLGEAPEDIQFQLDWLIAKHPIVRNNNLIMDEINQSNGNKSVVFPNLEYRRECASLNSAWEKAYLKKRLPRNPDLWSKSALNKRRNPSFTDLIPRGEKYIFKGRDLPKE